VTGTLGSGPFQLTEYRPAQAYILVATDYFRGRPLVEKIVLAIITEKSSALRAMLTGDLDTISSSLSPEVLAAFSGHKNIKIMTGLGYSTALLYFNCQRLPFADSKVRRAISLAINKQQIVETVLLGQAIQGSKVFVKPDSELYSLYPAETDLAKANALLDEAGFSLRDAQGIRLHNGNPMAYELLVYNEAKRLRTAELIAENLLALGLLVTVKSMDPDTIDSLVWPEFDVRTGRNYDLALWGWSAPVQINPSSASALLSSKPEIGNLNIGAFADSQIDEYCDQYMLSQDSFEQQVINQKIWARAAEVTPFIVLYNDDILNAVSLKNYTGWKMRQGVGVINKFSFLPARLEDK
jgi:peptide/nickel transport system substrate-binding protein